MSENHGRTVQEIEESIRESVKAALRGDPDGVDAATAPLYAEDACIWDSFTWTMGMIGLATAGVPMGPDFHAVPLIMVTDTSTMETREFHVDDAPEDCPKALVALIKLSAMYANGERQEAADVWEELIRHDETSPETEESVLADVMARALASAVQKTQELRARRSGMN